MKALPNKQFQATPPLRGVAPELRR